MWSLTQDFLQRHPLATGVLGTGASAGASMASFLQNVDDFVRVAGGVLGLAIAALTLAIQWRNFQTSGKRKPDDQGTDDQ